MRLIEKVLEDMKSDEKKMEYFKQNPILDATFHALYSYIKQGYSLTQLPWFELCDMS